MSTPSASAQNQPENFKIHIFDGTDSGNPMRLNAVLFLRRTATPKTEWENQPTWSFDRVVECIRSGEFKADIDNIQRIKREQGENAYKAVKGTMPGFIYPKLEFLALDIDAKDNSHEAMREGRKKLEARPDVFLCKKSVGGDGFSPMWKLPPGLTKEQIPAIREKLYAIARECGLEPDETYRRNSRFISCDPEVYYNPKAKNLLIDFKEEHLDKSSIPKKLCSLAAPPFSLSSYGSIERIEEVLQKKETYQEGKRHHYIFNLACMANRRGIREGTLTDYVKSKYPHFAQNPSNAISGPYKLYAHEHGINARITDELRSKATDTLTELMIEGTQEQLRSKTGPAWQTRMRVILLAEYLFYKKAKNHTLASGHVRFNQVAMSDPAKCSGSTLSTHLQALEASGWIDSVRIQDKPGDPLKRSKFVKPTAKFFEAKLSCLQAAGHRAISPKIGVSEQSIPLSVSGTKDSSSEEKKIENTITIEKNLIKKEEKREIRTTSSKKSIFTPDECRKGFFQAIKTVQSKGKLSIAHIELCFSYIAFVFNQVHGSTWTERERIEFVKRISEQPEHLVHMLETIQYAPLTKKCILFYLRDLAYMRKKADAALLETLSRRPSETKPADCLRLFEPGKNFRGKTYETAFISLEGSSKRPTKMPDMIPYWCEGAFYYTFQGKKYLHKQLNKDV